MDNLLEVYSKPNPLKLRSKKSHGPCGPLHTPLTSVAFCFSEFYTGIPRFTVCAGVIYIYISYTWSRGPLLDHRVLEPLAPIFPMPYFPAKMCHRLRPVVQWNCANEQRICLTACEHGEMRQMQKCKYKYKYNIFLYQQLWLRSSNKQSRDNIPYMYTYIYIYIFIYVTVYLLLSWPTPVSVSSRKRFKWIDMHVHQQSQILQPTICWFIVLRLVWARTLGK